jgi:hypothetical protein
MRKPQKNIGRLSMLLGSLGCIGWIIFIFIISDAFTKMDGSGWFILLLGSLVTYFILWFLVKGTYWIYVGFKPERRDK